MANFNRVILVGRLGRDPELRYLPSNTAVCSFSIAVNETWTKEGQKQERVSWIDIEAFAKAAELLNQYLRKGSQVMVEGKLRQDVWEKDGQSRSKLKVICENFQFMDGGKDDAPAPSTPRSAPTPAPQGGPHTPVDESDIPFAPDAFDGRAWL